MWGAHVSGETVSYGANLTSAVHHSFESRWAHRAHAAGGIPSTQRLSPEPVDRLVNELRVGRIAAAAGRVTTEWRDRHEQDETARTGARGRNRA